MNITILDGHTANPGDQSWAPLERQGNLTVFPRTASDEVIPRSQGARILLTNKVVLDRSILDSLPHLAYVGVLATGTNVVDGAALKERGIPLTNVPGYSTPSVAQHTLALLLELTNAVGRHSRETAEGAWSTSPDFAFWRQPLVELSGKVLGLVGYGAIGQSVAQWGRALGMKVWVHTRTPDPKHTGIRFVSLEELASGADVLSLHCPLTEATRHMVNRDLLVRMKPSAFLLNTGRGPLIDEGALAEALTAGRLAGAGLDVLSQEPPPENHPLLKAPRCVITPHNAWASKEARHRLIQIAAENIEAFFSGRPKNVVNGV